MLLYEEYTIFVLFGSIFFTVESKYKYAKINLKLLST